MRAGSIAVFAIAKNAHQLETLGRLCHDNDRCFKAWPPIPRTFQRFVYSNEIRYAIDGSSIRVRGSSTNYISRGRKKLEGWIFFLEVENSVNNMDSVNREVIITLTAIQSAG